MKPELRRIEATLGQINSNSTQSQHQPIIGAPTHPANPDTASAQQHQTHNLQAFPVSNFNSAHAKPQPIAPAASGPQASRPSLPKRSAVETVLPFPVQDNPKTPALPRSKSPSISHHRHAANPSLAVSLLKEIETKVGAWQQELEQVIQQVRSLYEDGPIVDGWLESHSPNQAAAGVQPKVATLRHAEIEHLMEYIEEICSAKPSMLEEPSGTHYRLCGLDADGQLWSRPCPAQQVPYVSLAIARYQKLRILLGKKQALENRLQQLVQTLTLLHSKLEA
ncbi:MAG: hypothetical protein HC772_19305 [Leptolyngbyaceae cyanobacterium CRU_2_3]|nr:hypothetical protein [Leptolyngbyaceae cyanobacterium CRU_2_3]